MMQKLFIILLTWLGFSAALTMPTVALADALGNHREMRKVDSMHDPIFKNLQLCYETEFAPITQTALQADGSYNQEELASHWSTKCDLYIFYINNKPAGFCVVNQGSLIDEARNHVHDFGEFYIMPLYRKQNNGLFFAATLIKLYGGVWQIRQLPELEHTARAFWLTVIKSLNVVDFKELTNHAHWQGFVQEFRVIEKQL